MLEEAVEHSASSTPLPDPLLGATLGAYTILRPLGSGGMGSVYLAERREGFQQQVAIKTLRRGVDTDDVIRRFLAERQILAQLDHPNVAKLFDGGTTPDGRPYFVMEFVRGEPITAHADAQRLDVPARLDLMKTVAGALQHAHQHLVVHRDLKPSNVLVSHDGVVKLLDFGIARLIGSEHRWGQTRTSTGLRMLTPAYAAPEQVAREPVTTATDVYQLGALLFELLAGVRPFDRDLPEAELERHIAQIDPDPLSKAVRRAPSPTAALRGFTQGRCPADALSRALQGDLDTIAAKALAKEPARRYSSAERLAEDIDRHLRGRPIAARRPTARYRFGRFVRRNRWFVPGAVAATMLLGLYLGSSARHNRQLMQERNLARAEAERAEAVTAFVTGLFASPNPWSGGTATEITVLEALDEGVRRINVEFADRPELQARLLGVIGESYHWLHRKEQAERVLRRAVDVLEAVRGPNAIETLVARLHWGRTLNSGPGPDSALAVLRPVLEALSEPSSYEEARLRAEVLGELARVHSGVPALDTSLAYYRASDEAFAALDPPEPVAHGEMLRHYSRVLGRSDRDGNTRIAERAVALLSAALPPDHIELAAAHQDLGSAYSGDPERLDDSLAQFDRALAVFEARLEPYDPNLLAVRNNRALLLSTMERFKESEEEYRTIEKLQRSWEPDSRGHADVLQNLASVLIGLGNQEEAVSLSWRAHEIYKAKLGTHWLTAFPLLTIGSVEMERGRWREALRLNTQAYEILVQTLPVGHYARGVALCRLGQSRMNTGDHAGGLNDLRTAVAALQASSLEPEHTYRAACETALAAVGDAQSR